MSKITEWEDKMLATPLAGKVSSEHDEHKAGDAEFVPPGDNYRNDCMCKRCVIIRIKKRRAFRFPMTKCCVCGKLIFSLYKACEECRKQ